MTPHQRLSIISGDLVSIRHIFFGSRSGGCYRDLCLLMLIESNILFNPPRSDVLGVAAPYHLRVLRFDPYFHCPNVEMIQISW